MPFSYLMPLSGPDTRSQTNLDICVLADRVCRPDGDKYLCCRSKLSIAECAVAACVCSRLRGLAYQEVLWEALCRRDWGLNKACRPDLRLSTYR